MYTNSIIPICPHCGQPLRKAVQKPHWPIVGSINNAYDGKVPWNYLWDGKCESCGYNHNISIGQSIPCISPEPENKDKLTTVKVCSRKVMTFLDSATVLSGVEIETHLDGEKKSLFLSTNELKFLMDLLKDSPIIQQLDWGEDYT